MATRPVDGGARSTAGGRGMALSSNFSRYLHEPGLVFEMPTARCDQSPAGNASIDFCKWRVAHLWFSAMCVCRRTGLLSLFLDSLTGFFRVEVHEGL